MLTHILSQIEGVEVCESQPSLQHVLALRLGSNTNFTSTLDRRLTN